MRFLSIILLAVFLLNTARGECLQARLHELRDKGALFKILEKKKAELKENPDDAKILKSLGIICHNLGILKIRGASQEAVRYLRRANELMPDDYEVLAYLGSAETMIARDSWNPIKKISCANEGIRLIDEAVYKDPGNIIVMLVRINNSLFLPKLFKRSDLAKEDLLHLLELSKRRKEDFTLEMMAEIYFYLGNICMSENNSIKAREYWEKAAKVAPDSTWGRKAKGKL